MKKYLITDPCYILPSDIWTKCCKEAFTNENRANEIEIFEKCVTDALRAYTHTKDAVVSDTGYGDWSNAVFCDNNSNKVINSRFFADSGNVCIVEYNDKVAIGLINNNNEHLIENGGAALIQVDNDPVIEIDKSDRTWTMITIKDGSDTFSTSSGIVSDESYDFDDDEDEDDYEDDEYYRGE